MDYYEIAQQIFEQLKNNTSISLNEVLNDFNKGEIGVLSYLAFEKDEVYSGELSEKLNVSTARIASVLNSLETKNYIKREESLTDKRKTLVKITSEGKDLAYKTKEQIINKIAIIIQKLGYNKMLEYVKIATEIKQILKNNA